jgi:hypothetical protein
MGNSRSKCSVHSAWENHFAAFNSQDVEQIALDYTDESVIRIFDHSTDKVDVYSGIDGAKKFFTCLFAKLNDLSSLDAPSLIISEEKKYVSLAWKCPSSGVIAAHDVFLFDRYGKIKRQNIAYHSAPTLSPVVSEKSDYSPKSIQEAWDNHFSAFGEQRVDKILLDYTEASTLCIFDHATGKETKYAGISQISDCFHTLFAKLTDLSTLSAPCIVVEEAPVSQVFLTWKCPGCDVYAAHDTFHFNSDNKIVSQHIALTSSKI